MRKVTLTLACAIIFLFALSNQTYAAAPQLINYQGVLADSTGAGLDTTVDITFGIYENAVSLTPIWVEAHAAVTVTGGLFSVLLGSTTPLDVSIFGGSILYLGITIGADPEISPRTQIVTVAYAFHAEQADNADLATNALHADTADFADTSALAVLALVTELAIFADSARVADELDSLSSEDFSRTGHTHGAGGGGGWTDDGTVVRLDASADSVGIGTTTPTEKLEVSGNIKASGTIQSGSSIIIDGVSDKITASSGTIDFDNENLITTGKATIGPGHTNTGLNAFVAGEINTASNDNSTVSGGKQNSAQGMFSSVGGGHVNTALGNYSTVGGGFLNYALSLATVGGGQGDTASGNFSTVGGGLINNASGHLSTVGGGSLNIAEDSAATVGGGRNNKARGVFSVVAGGGGPSAIDSNSAIGSYSSIGGGTRNIAGDYAATVAGGDVNWALGVGSFIGGGASNLADGFRATVPGGFLNVASGEFSFAAGVNAKADHDETFVWADNSGAAFSSTAMQQFLIRSAGGVGINTNAPFTDLTVGGSIGFKNSAEPMMFIYESGTNNITKPIAVHSPSFPGYGIFYRDSLDAIMFKGSVNAMTVRLDLGRVGINSTAPTQALHVAGNICATGSIGACSDIRFKKNITSLTGANELLSKLRAVNYNWKSDEFPDHDFTDKNQIGFIAQEILEVLPQVVEQGSDGYYQIDYSRFTPLLVEAVKEQQQEISELKKRLEEVEILLKKLANNSTENSGEKEYSKVTK